jgi:hypothetical protein
MPRCRILDSLTGLPLWPCESVGYSDGPPEMLPVGVPTEPELEDCWERWGMLSGLCER